MLKLLRAALFALPLLGAGGTVLGQTAPRATASASLENYVLAPTDRILVKVFQEEDLTTDARISNDGTVIIPLIGSIHVAGGTIQSATAEIRQRLKSGYLVNPQVTVTVTEFSKRRFTVMGQVQKGGTYVFPDQGALDLLQVIGMAGGFTRLADRGKITVQRNLNGKSQTYRLNGKAMAEGKDQPFDILPGDTITVGESWF